jgi:hypothetical protein
MPPSRRITRLESGLSNVGWLPRGNRRRSAHAGPPWPRVLVLRLLVPLSPLPAEPGTERSVTPSKDAP